MVGVAGPELSPQEREWLRHPLVGGVTLFTRNYASLEQLQALTADIHRLRDPHLLIAVDQEGGRVQRLRDGFTRLPAPTRLGILYDAQPRRARFVAEQWGWLMASELRAVGIDLSFAPVLDVDRGLNQVIGDRAFHRDPEVVADLGRAFLGGMQRSGMAAVGKHFPGHGGVAADSHVAVPVDERRFADLYMEDILPFERLVHVGLPGIMAAHVIYPRVAPEPASLSPFWLEQVLRKRMGFQGVIFSDDLGMQGASVAGDLLDRARAAHGAGCDMILLCNELGAIPRLLDGLQQHPDPAAQARLARMHGRQAAGRSALLRDPAWHQAAVAIAAMEEATSLELDLGEPGNEARA